MEQCELNQRNVCMFVCLYVYVCLSSPDEVADLEQLYELWLQSQRQGWNEESSNCALRENGKQIHMPTDYAEEVVRHRMNPQSQGGLCAPCLKTSPYATSDIHLYPFLKRT